MKTVLPILLAITPQIGFSQPPEALWLNEDQSVIIATGACEAGSRDLCSIIVGLRDKSYATWAKELCGLPVFWGLKPGRAPGRWTDGKVIDVATEKAVALDVAVYDRSLVLIGKDGTKLTWKKTEEAPVGCGGE